MGKLKRQVSQGSKKENLKKRTGSAKKALVDKKSKNMMKQNKRNDNILKKNSRRASNLDEKKDINEVKDEEFEVAPSNDTTDSLEHIIPKIKNDDCTENHEGEDNMRILVKNQNKKKHKQSGGFQSMGLSYNTYKGVIRKGYKVPTPIQRKTIPLIMDGKDVVGMARTGSGKTGAFLIPMLEKLNVHSSGAVRAVILSPTRELALQTLKFTHELGKFTDLKSSLIVGGDSIENQFAALHNNPDILIATPGRLLHVLVEMDIKQLDSVEYVVFDEADRLFEMGFAEQLKEIIQRIPQSRQTVLFSATLPKVLVDFATAGLNDPTLIRLDVDTKISEKLKTSYFMIRDEDKTSCLLHVLSNVVKPDELTVIFVSTRHHVDYLHELLNCAGLSSSFIYSSLDQTARKLNLSNFRNKKTKILLVTDIAARGIDVPMLDNVINFDFPPRPKIFVHRVGRVARAGRSGNAYSFVLKEELPFLLDLHLFLGRPVKYASGDTETDDDGIVGTVPQSVIVNEVDYITNMAKNNYNLVASHKVMRNGYKGYVRTREAASVESNKRAKEINVGSIATHPCFKNVTTETSGELSKLLCDLRKFKPPLTVFESLTTKKTKSAEQIMQLKRKQHHKVIEREKQRQEEKPLVISKKEVSFVSDDKYIAESFNIHEKSYKDENFIPHQSADGHQEKGLSLSSFEKDAKSISVDLISDETKQMQQDKASKKWDRKRKKFVGVDNPHAKKFKTESGNYIPKSYKSDKYKEWVKNNQFNHKKEEDSDKNSKQTQSFGPNNRFKKKISSAGSGRKVVKGTVKSKDQIVKKRMKDDLMEKIRRKSKTSTKNGKVHGRNAKLTNKRFRPTGKKFKKQRK